MRSHTAKIALVAVAAILPAAAAGCVSLMAHGADARRGAPSAYRARLVAQNCRLSAGDKVGDPKQTYYLALDGGAPVLIELDASADGVTVRNAWTDDHGQHFFVWISGGPGYEFFIPRDAGQTARRFF